ncbi:hypothetical protein KY329_04940, partial [Candidatus Woesearchaeota archaeon]|nr:hypothetical protein [Candidatus Woesearchaeota archaeon]
TLWRQALHKVHEKDNHTNSYLVGNGNDLQRGGTRMEKGSICVKIAGRDAGKKCVVIEKKGYRVLIDGETRRREVNQSHLIPTGEKIELKTGSHDEVKTAFKQLGIEITDKKPKQAAERQKKKRKADLKQKPVKKVTKKAVAQGTKKKAEEKKQ